MKITFKTVLVLIAVGLLASAGFDVDLNDDVHEGFLGLAFLAAAHL